MLSLGSNRVATGDSPSWLAMECHLLSPHGGTIFAFILFVSTRAHTFWISLFPTKFPNSLFGAKFWIQMQPNCSIVALCVLNDRHMYALTVAFILGCRIVNVAD